MESLSLSQLEGNPLVDVLFSEDQRFTQLESSGLAQLSSNEMDQMNCTVPLPHKEGATAGCSDMGLTCADQPLTAPHAATQKAAETADEDEELLEDADVDLVSSAPKLTEEDGRRRLGRLRRLDTEASDLVHSSALQEGHLHPAGNEEQEHHPKRFVKNRIKVKSLGPEEEDSLFKEEEGDEAGETVALGDRAQGMEAEDSGAEGSAKEDAEEDGGEGEDYWDEEDEYLELLDDEKGE